MLMLSTICSVFFLMLLRLTDSTTTINIILRPRHDESPIDDLSCKSSPDKMMTITLKPKGLNDTNSFKSFQCGVDESIDAERLVGEWNSPMIFQYLKSKDTTTPAYQTEVNDVIKFDTSGQPVMGMEEEAKDGVYSLFISPPSSECDIQTLDQAVNGEEGFYPVFVGASNNFSDPKNKFLNEIQCLEKHYGAKKPNLCSSKLPKSHLTAISRIKTLQTIYNFAYNNERNLNLNKIKQCKSEKESKEAIAKSDMFDLKPECHFKENNQTVLESQGFMKAIIERKTSDKKSIIMVKTILSSDQGSASESDIVPFDNVAVFDKNEKFTEVFITLKSDNVKENDERFNLTIEPFIESRRNKRDTNEKLSEKLHLSQEITIVDMQCYLEKDPLCGRVFWLVGIKHDHLNNFLGPWQIIEPEDQQNHQNKWENRKNEYVIAFKEVDGRTPVSTWVVTKQADAPSFNKMDHCEMMKDDKGEGWIEKKTKKNWEKKATPTIKFVKGVCEDAKDCSEVAGKPECDKRPDADLGLCRSENEYCKVDKDCKLAATPTCNTDTFTCVECSQDPAKDYTHVTDLDCNTYECKCETNELKRILSLTCESFWYDNAANTQDTLGNFHQAGPELKIMIKRGNGRRGDGNEKEGHFHLDTATPAPTIVTVNCPYVSGTGTDWDIARIRLYNQLVEKCRKAVNDKGFTFYEQSEWNYKKDDYDKNFYEYTKGKGDFQEGMWRKTEDFKRQPGFFFKKQFSTLGGNGPKKWSCAKRNVEVLLLNIPDIDDLLKDIFQ